MRISMPRSPRATITQSAARTISSARWTACGFSILAISGSRVCLRSDVTSSARRTNESATRSTPIRSPVRTWSRSSSGTEGSAAVSPGMLRPWREATLPPTSTSASISPSAGRVALHAQADGAVGEVHDLARVDGVGQPGPRDVHPARVAVRGVLAAHERHVVAGLELGDPVRERADAQLRARQVLQHGHLAAGAAGGLAHERRGLRVLLRRAVGEVQAGDVHPRLDHADQHLGVTRCGSDGRDDLRAAHSTPHATYCARSTYLGSVNVGYSFGLETNLRTRVWSR